MIDDSVGLLVFAFAWMCLPSWRLTAYHLRLDVCLQLEVDTAAGAAGCFGSCFGSTRCSRGMWVQQCAVCSAQCAVRTQMLGTVSSVHSNAWHCPQCALKCSAMSGVCTQMLSTVRSVKCHSAVLLSSVSSVHFAVWVQLR